MATRTVHVAITDAVQVPLLVAEEATVKQVKHSSSPLFSFSDVNHEMGVELHGWGGPSPGGGPPEPCSTETKVDGMTVVIFFFLL